MTESAKLEIPQQLRELTERNIEQARTGYGQFMDAVAQAMGIWVTAIPANPMTSGFKVVQDRAIEFAKQNAEASFGLARGLTSAKDLTDVMWLQARHAQTLVQTYAQQAQELGCLMIGASQNLVQKQTTGQPIEP